MEETQIKPHQDSTESKRQQVEEMFDVISKDYDFMNRMMTFGMDKKWRKKVLQKIKNHHPKTILDVATGTGDMPILLSATDAKSIVGIDISKGMLAVADKKIKIHNLQDRISTSVQNSEKMTFENNSFEAATVLYGIRNFENLSEGLSEIYRVLKKDGIFVILETSVPENKLIKWGYLFYTKLILPLIAKLFSDNTEAYTYLSNSALHFPYGKKLKKILEGVGFKKVTVAPQFFGASSIYVAYK